MNRIKELRINAGLSQKELGDMVGLTHAAVSRHENGSRGLDELMIKAYSKALEVQAHELFVKL